MRRRGAVAIPVIHGLAWFIVTAATADNPVMAGERPAVEVPDASSPGAGPQELMTQLSTALFSALDREPAAVRHDADRMLPLLDRLLAPHFDRDYSARLVLGAHWGDATADQRRQFALALYRRLLRTYAGAVGGWTSDRVKVLPWAGDSTALQVLVRTEVKGADGAVAAVDYRLHQTASGWMIFDVIVDGISYVRSYHADTDQEVARRGLDATIIRLSDRDGDRASSPKLPAAARIQ